MTRLLQAVANCDSGTLSQIAGNTSDKPKQCVLNVNTERLVDALFRQFKQVFPAAGATNLRTLAEESAAKKQWVVAFAENGITTREQLAAGMRWARAKDTPFMPSPGQFIEQCKAGARYAVGLPDADELYRRVMKYCGERGFYKCPENYPWETNADYWMITALYSQMKAGNLTELELLQRCKKQLKTMAKRVTSGEDIPEPRKQLPQLYIPSKPDIAKAHIADIRVRFGFRKA